jgi:hypothetical protein
MAHVPSRLNEEECDIHERSVEDTASAVIYFKGKQQTPSSSPAETKQSNTIQPDKFGT